jgi:hypothetical protein
MKNWWERRPQRSKVLIVLAVAAWLYALCFVLGLILALPASEGKPLKLGQEVPVFGELLSFLILLPVFLITTVLGFLEKRISTVALLFFYAVLIYWLISKTLGYPPAISEILADFAYLFSVAQTNIHSNEGFLLFVLLIVSLQPALTLSLTILPRKYDFCVLILFGIILPVFLVTLYIFLIPNSHSECHSPVTPLMLSAGYGTAEEVKSQFAKGIDINAKNIYGTNALMYAALSGKSENIKLLLAAGARVNDQDDEGSTALSLALQQGHQEVVALLLAAGAKDLPLKP